MVKNIVKTLLGVVIITVLIIPFALLALLIGPNYLVVLFTGLPILGLIILLSWLVGDISYDLLQDRATKKTFERAAKIVEEKDAKR